MVYQYGLLKPLRQERAQEHNALLLGENTLGIEVTDAVLARQCGLGNIDPQHSEGRTDIAAVEAALDFPVPPANSILVTIRPDLDAFGAMALLSFRAENNIVPQNIKERVGAIGQQDRFANGEWPGKKKLPTGIAEYLECISGNMELAPLNAATRDFRLNVKDRVALVRKWLEGGTPPQKYQRQVHERARKIMQAVEGGELKFSLVANGNIVLFEGNSDGAVQLGYRLAPVVVAFNPVFQPAGGQPYRKFTICQYSSGYVDLPSVARQLNDRENGWGGSPVIIGSPQGRSSLLAFEEVVGVVQEYLPESVSCRVHILP